jgi:hypothetical protein
LRSALQALGRADRRHRDVDPHAGAPECRQRSRHDHSRHVFRFDLRSIHCGTQPLEHLGQRPPDHRRAGVVTAGIEADDDSEAGQRVVANPLDGHQIFESVGHTYTLSRAVFYQGLAAGTEGDYANAAKFFEEALLRSRQVGNRPSFFSSRRRRNDL